MADNEEPQIFKKRYKVDKKLGAGNFGTAYLVNDLKGKSEPKVLKVVRLGEMDPEQSVDSVREAELLSHLDNEHIVKFYESFLENDCLCIVTEFCEGGDLDQHLKELKKQNRTLHEDQIVEWLIEILIAVQYMHKSRILHRDLKARNIFLKSNKIKIGDFGISRILVGTMDVATTFTGTPYYMSPEVMKHDGYESKSDIWSVGCLLYEMCTNQHAFDGKGLMNVIYKVVEGKPPELPKHYSKELNDLLKKIFIKDPKNRPSAAQLLQTPFMIAHRERTKLTGPLENTASGNLRSKAINEVFESTKTFGQMQKDNWGISGKDNIVDDENDVPSYNVSSTQHQDEEEDEEQQLTIKPANTFKAARQSMIERKMQEADIRGQQFTQAIRSNAVEANKSRQATRDNQNSKAVKPSRSSGNRVEEKEKPINNRARNPTQVSQEKKPNNRSGAMNSPTRNNFDDRPITPMRGSFKEVAEIYGDEYDSQSYDNRSNERSPTRQRESDERTLRYQRTLSASQRSTMNSMSRTMDPRYPAKYQQQVKQMAPSRTIGSAKRQNTTLNASVDDEGATLKDDPSRDVFGKYGKDSKIHNLRTKAIQTLGEDVFERVYDYIVKHRTAQKTNPNLDDIKLSQDLRKFVKNPSDCFYVDQLVFLELYSNN